MLKYFLPLVIVLLSSCSSWKYLGEYDHEADFTSYETFGLLGWDAMNDEVMSPQTKKYLLLAIKDQLEKRGYVYQEKDADLQISVFAIVKEETSYSAYSDHYAGYNGYSSVSVGVSVGSGGVGVGAYGYGMNMYPYTVVKHDYDVGTVVIDLLDHAKKQLIWQGVATGRVVAKEGSEAKIKSKVNKLFATLPVKKGKKK